MDNVKPKEIAESNFNKHHIDNLGLNDKDDIQEYDKADQAEANEDEAEDDGK